MLNYSHKIVLGHGFIHQYLVGNVSIYNGIDEYSRWYTERRRLNEWNDSRIADELMDDSF